MRVTQKEQRETLIKVKVKSVLFKCYLHQIHQTIKPKGGR